MKKMKKFVALAAVASLAAATFAGCGKSEGSGSSNTGSDVWKIGSIGPTTGTAAIYGNAVKNGASIAVDESTRQAESTVTRLSSALKTIRQTLNLQLMLTMHLRTREHRYF